MTLPCVRLPEDVAVLEDRSSAVERSITYLARLPDGPLVMLEGAAALIWEELMRARTVAVAEQVARRVGADVSLIHADVEEFVETLADQGLIEVDGRPARKRLEAPTTPPAMDALAPIRVAFVDHCARLSGAEIAMVRLIEALGGRVDATVILAEDGPLVARLQQVGARVEVLPLDSRTRELDRHLTARRPTARALGSTSAYVWRLARRLRQLRPDIVHTMSLKAAVYGIPAARLSGTPVVWHLHDRVAPDYLPGVAVGLLRGLARTGPTMLLANSSATLATVPGARRGRVVPNPIPLPAPEHRERPFDAVRVGIVGRLAPWKGQDVFVRAFAEAFQPGSPVRGVIIGAALFGEEEHEEALRRLCRELDVDGRVEITGFVEDVEQAISRLDVLVHCSTVPEPFGQVVVEGMAAGLAVVASAAGGPTEVITNGHDGMLVPPGDVAALADALRTLASDEDLRLKLGRAALIRAQDFSPERAGEAVLHAYDIALRRAPGVSASATG